MVITDVSGPMVSVQPIRPETSVRSYRYLPRSRSDDSYQDFVLLESREVSVLDFIPLLHRRRVQLKRDGTRSRTGGEVKGNWRMEWVASTLTLPRNMVYSALLRLMRTPRLPVVDGTDAPADLN